MKDLSQLDKYYPPCGSCLFCGHPDKRHRLWDTFLSLLAGGESIEFIARLYNTDVKHVELVNELKPYQ
jgi:hypothetical protein